MGVEVRKVGVGDVWDRGVEELQQVGPCGSLLGLWLSP